jgi:hypothetical protein
MHFEIFDVKCFVMLPYLLRKEIEPHVMLKKEKGNFATLSI